MVFVGVILLMPDHKTNSECLYTVSLTLGTDDQGDMFLRNELLFSKHALGVVLLESSDRHVH